MKANNELKVGIVAVLGLLLLVAGIILGQGYVFGDKANILKLRFNNSGGIKVSSPVVINGVKRGTIISVEPSNGSVLIEAQLDKIDDLKEDAFAKITILEITGGKKIEINPGKSANKFNIANELIGSNTSDIPDLVATLGEVSGDAVNLIKRLDTITTSINRIFSNDTLFKRIDATVRDLNILVSNANSLLKNNYTELDKSIKNVKEITTDLKDAIKDNRGNVDTILVQLKSTLKEARSAIASLEETSKSGNKLIGDISSITTDIKSNGSIANRILYDKQLAIKLDSTFIKLQSLVDFINANGVNVNVRLGTRP
jgi:phospholipid/cholesterol/gamma-HCH transport system substrate-binding protein